MSDQPSNAELMAHLENIGNDTKDIKNRLFGNGAPGLIRTVDRHDRWIRFQQWVTGVFLVLISGVIVTGVVSAGMWIVKAMA